MPLLFTMFLRAPALSSAIMTRTWPKAHATLNAVSSLNSESGNSAAAEYLLCKALDMARSCRSYIGCELVEVELSNSTGSRRYRWSWYEPRQPSGWGQLAACAHHYREDEPSHSRFKCKQMRMQSRITCNAATTATSSPLTAESNTCLHSAVMDSGGGGDEPRVPLAAAA